MARRELVRPTAFLLVAMLLGHDITVFAGSTRDVLNVIADLILVLVIGQPLTEVA